LRIQDQFELLLTAGRLPCALRAADLAIIFSRSLGAATSPHLRGTPGSSNWCRAAMVGRSHRSGILPTERRVVCGSPAPHQWPAAGGRWPRRLGLHSSWFSPFSDIKKPPGKVALMGLAFQLGVDSSTGFAQVISAFFKILETYFSGE